MKEYVLPPEALDSLYQQWLVRVNHSDINYRYPARYTYKHVSRQCPIRGRHFEDWLWTQRFSVFQKNKERYAKFVGSEKELTLFLLKNNL